MKFKNIFFIVGVVFVGFGIYWYTDHAKIETGKYDDFAKCLQDKGVAMYGADSCSHCQDQKRRFGSSFQYIEYIECTEEIDRCRKNNIFGYPTWIFPNGKRIEGEMELEELSRESGCTLPEIK